MNPCGSLLFQLSHEIRQAVRRLQPDEKMHMIGDTPDSLSNTTQPIDLSTEILVKSIPPFRHDR